MATHEPVRYSVSLDELQDRVDEMATFEARIEQTLDHVGLVVAGLHVTWTGEAALAHAEAHQQWAAGLAQMREGLALVRAAAEANAAMWASVR